jgi:ribosome-associated protein
MAGDDGVEVAGAPGSAGVALVTPGGIVVPEAALTWRFSRAGGPGGQHVNTSDSRAELWCETSALRGDQSVLLRVRESVGERVRVVAAQERSQWRNRRLAMERLSVRLDRAAARRPVRRPTRVPRAAVEQRLESKRRQSARKVARRAPLDE